MSRNSSVWDRTQGLWKNSSKFKKLSGFLASKFNELVVTDLCTLNMFEQVKPGFTNYQPPGLSNQILKIENQRLKNFVNDFQKKNRFFML